MDNSLQRYSKTALVLAGGGLTGAVYEIGALRAINDLLVDREVSDFDIFVGTSAGALVSSMLVNEIKPQSMMQSIDGSHPEIGPIERKHIFNVKRTDLAGMGVKLPRKLLDAWIEYLKSFNDMTLFDFFWSLIEVLPAGLYDGLALEKYIRNVLNRVGVSNHFDELEKELYIVATDLDSGERMIFSRETPGVPISLAVAASSAVPLLYKPVRIGSNDYIDGGMRGNASLDIAIEAGADLVVCINPMVPFNNSDHRSFMKNGDRDSYLSDKGVSFIANQVTRILTHSSIRYHIKQLRRSHPQVDIILIEPRPDDYQMFFNSPMRYSARLAIAQHGFESATLGLAEDYPEYKDILARHGINITRRLVIQELERMHSSGNKTEILREILESRLDPCAEANGNDPVCQLNRTLDDLDNALNRLLDDKAVMAG